MTDYNLRELILNLIITLIEQTFSEKAVMMNYEMQRDKSHFIPLEYRVFGGRLQSLNIKLGNFIETLLAEAIQREPQLELLPEARQKLDLAITQETAHLIEDYMNRRREAGAATDCREAFAELLSSIVQLENSTRPKNVSFRQDIDMLFRTSTGVTIYLESKYNDDHDTGKFRNINRKLIDTYAGLVAYLGIRSTADLMPILYYFNASVRYGPLYLPESHVYRGARLFQEYFAASFSDLDDYLAEIASDPAVMSKFDEAYRRIRGAHFGQ